MSNSLNSRPIWQRGIAAAVLSGLASVVILLVANAMISGSVQVPESMSSKALVDLTAGQVFGASVIGLVFATVVALLLHRSNALSPRVPLILGIGTILSLASPFTISGATNGTRVALTLMHIACGAIAIALLGRRSSSMVTKL